MATVDYNIGDGVPLVVTFTNSAGALADPDEVIFRFREPDGTLVEQEHWTSAVPGADITRVSLGVFSATIPITKSGGYYSWHWLAKGAVQKAVESTPDTALHVRTSSFTAV